MSLNINRGYQEEWCLDGRLALWLYLVFFLIKFFIYLISFLNIDGWSALLSFFPYLNHADVCFSSWVCCYIRDNVSLPQRGAEA